MTKDHYISFIAYVTNNRCEIVKLYLEQNVETRFLKKGKGIIYAYCNKDGLIFVSNLEENCTNIIRVLLFLYC